MSGARAVLALTIAVAVAGVGAVTGKARPFTSAGADSAAAGYVVWLKDGVRDPRDVAGEHVRHHGAQVTHVYRSAIKGYAATLAAAGADAVREDPRVVAVERDRAVRTLGQVNPTAAQRVFSADADCDPSDNPAVNQKLLIDCTDNGDVDADIAVIDTGINPEPDLDIVHRVDCTLLGCPLDDTGEVWPHHGTGVARAAAARDNGIGGVGVAPGARLWSVRVLMNGIRPNMSLSDPESMPVDIDTALSHVIAGVDWVHQHADEIEVANMSLGCKRPWTGDPEEDLFPGVPECENGSALHAAIDSAIGAGVVFVVAAGNAPGDTELGTPQDHLDVVNVSLMADFDGLPGGLAAARDCDGDGVDEQQDDAVATYSAFGSGVEIAAPGACGGTSAAAPQVSGAAALLASECPPSSRAGVLAIRNAVMAEGSYDWIEDSGDGIHEPLLDVSEETVFAPVMKDGASSSGGAGTGCDWVSTPAESDVDGDGRSDLVTVDAAGNAHVFRGLIDGHPHGSIDVGGGVSSLGGVDSALLDGDGEYVVDVSDVTGDRRADLVTVESGGGMRVRPGRADRTFGAVVDSLWFATPAMAGAGGALAGEPVGVADVTGDGLGDLVSIGINPEGITMFPGVSDGTFTTDGWTSSLEGEVDPALLDGEGHYPLDVTDVDGDGLADLVTVDTSNELDVNDTANSLNVYLAQPSGHFAAPIEAGSMNPVMDDGWFHEPVGLGDVNGDGRADLVALWRNLTLPYWLSVRLGQADGTFGAPTNPLPGSGIDSSLLDGTGSEAVDLLDYNRDGNADLVTIDETGTLHTYETQVDPATGAVTFAAPVAQAGGTTPTVRDNATGHEPATEKPMIRRAGCTPNGCAWP